MYYLVWTDKKYADHSEGYATRKAAETRRAQIARFGWSIGSYITKL